MNAMTLVAVPQGGDALDVLATRYRAAFDKLNGGRAQWIDGTLELALVVAEVRRDRPDHRAFSHWLAQNKFEQLHPNDRSALVGFAQDPKAARKMLEASNSISWRVIWEKRPKRQIGTPTKIGKGTTSARGHLSGSDQRKRKREPVIPTVMREDYVSGTRTPAAPPPARPERKGIKLRGLTREEVDPNFVGTPLEFSTKYGHVNIHTKQQIEHHKNQEQLMAWLGLVSDLDRAARVLTVAAVDPETLHQWMGKPAKAGKLRAWCGNIESACESLRNLCLGLNDAHPN